MSIGRVEREFELCMFCMEPPAGFALLAIPKKVGGNFFFPAPGTAPPLPLPHDKTDPGYPSAALNNSTDLENSHFHTPHTQFPHFALHAPPKIKSKENPRWNLVEKPDFIGKPFPISGNAGMTKPRVQPTPNSSQKKNFFGINSRSCFASAYSKQEKLPRENFPEGSQFRIRFPAPWMFLFLGFCCSDVSSRY